MAAERIKKATSNGISPESKKTIYQYYYSHTYHQSLIIISSNLMSKLYEIYQLALKIITNTLNIVLKS